MFLSYFFYGVRVSDVFSGEKLKFFKMRFLSGKIVFMVESLVIVEEYGKR